MIVTRNWLQEWIDISQINSEKLVKILNEIGLEVDSYSEIRLPQKVVIGYVKSKRAHENSDKLNICEVDVGSEIYTMLRSCENVKIYITGEACSAASIVAMAGYCEMSPTALMMVHCVSTGARGNHSAMEHTAEVLRTADKALCSAYTTKTGMSEDEALNMMEHETWLTAEQAKEKKLVDAIMFEEKEEKSFMVAGNFELPSEEMLGRIRQIMGQTEEPKQGDSVFLLQQKLNFLRMKGETR